MTPDRNENKTEKVPEASFSRQRLDLAFDALVSHLEVEPPQEKVDIPDKEALLSRIRELPNNVSSGKVGNVNCMVTKTRDPRVFSLLAEETLQVGKDTVKYRTTYIINDGNGKDDTRTSVVWRPDNPTNSKGLRARVVKEAWDILEAVR